MFIFILIIIFAFQGKIILGNPLHTALIAVPLIIQTFLVFILLLMAGVKHGNFPTALLPREQ